MNGYELAKRVRAKPGAEKAFLIALTGFGLDEDVYRSREAGFDHHFTKPINPVELQSLLATLNANRGVTAQHQP